MGCYEASIKKKKENKKKSNKPKIISGNIPKNEIEKINKNKVEIIDNLKNIKSKYILKSIFYNLYKGMRLKIIKYNKRLQKRLDIDINDHKDYKIIEIEIEMKLDYNNNCKFINIFEEDQPYFHIYFNNSIEEISRNYINKDDNVSKIKIIIDNGCKCLCKLFKNCINIKKINFIKFNRKAIQII